MLASPLLLWLRSHCRERCCTAGRLCGRQVFRTSRRRLGWRRCVFVARVAEVRVRSSGLLHLLLAPGRLCAKGPCMVYCPCCLQLHVFASGGCLTVLHLALPPACQQTGLCLVKLVGGVTGGGRCSAAAAAPSGQCFESLRAVETLLGRMQCSGVPYTQTAQLYAGSFPGGSQENQYAQQQPHRPPWHTQKPSLPDDLTHTS